MAEERRNFLLEIGTEELPASYISPARRQLEEWGKKWAPKRQVKTWSTPRRLTVFIENLPRFRVETIWGPPLDRARDERGNWNKNAAGFVRGRGGKLSDLRVGRKGGRSYVRLTVRSEQGENLKSEIAPLLESLSFPKSMRWVPNSSFRFPRPIRWLVCLWGSEILDLSVAGVKSNRVTRGHRFFGKGSVSLPEADLDEYGRRLERNFVIADPARRRRRLAGELLKKKRKYRPKMRSEELDPKLVEEVCNLVEYPRVIEGGFEERYLSLPAPVLVTVMKSHQRYFPIHGPGGALLPRFLIVANGPYRDTAGIRKNNERVLRARLADAEFFWKEDLARPLARRAGDLKGVIFHARLGSYFDKVERLKKLSSFIAAELGLEKEKRRLVRRAAALCKNDLTTAMVTEFTDLQGVMGREYARRSGEDEETAGAIGEHYLPRSADDALPESAIGAVVSLADKLDTVTAFLAAGIEPSGSQDPYGLRRQALGIIRILLELKLALPIDVLIEETLNCLGLKSAQGKEAKDRILSFFKSRLKSYYETRGVASDAVEAVLGSAWYDFGDTGSRIDMLGRLEGSEVLRAATTVVERTYNIFRREKLPARSSVRPDLLAEKAEKNLYRICEKESERVRREIEKRNYEKATALYARAFSKPLHDFFDNVLVNVTDKRLRKNRLLLLKMINRLYSEKVADLSLLQFERGEYLI